MRISVNLATRPFVELRPLFQRLRIVMAALGVLAIVLGIWLHSATKRAHAAQAQMDALVKQTRAFQQERTGNESKMHQPANASVLERSQFLNAVFIRKSFSWTAVMMDLENVLPSGVQVTHIEPSILPSGELQIRLRVSGDRDRAVQLVKNLEHSQCFVAPRLASEAAQTQDPNQHGGAPVNLNAVEFDILAGYNPLPVHLRKKAAAIEETKEPKKEKTVGVVLPVFPHTNTAHPAKPQPAGRRPQ